MPKAAINSLSRIFDLLPSPDPPPDPLWMDGFQYPAGLPGVARDRRSSRTKTKYETPGRSIPKKLITPVSRDERSSITAPPSPRNEVRNPTQLASKRIDKIAEFRVNRSRDTHTFNRWPVEVSRGRSSIFFPPRETRERSSCAPTCARFVEVRATSLVQHEKRLNTWVERIPVHGELCTRPAHRFMYIHNGDCRAKSPAFYGTSWPRAQASSSTTFELS